MEVIKQLLIEYGPSLLSAVVSALVAFIGKKIATNYSQLETTILRSVADNIERLDAKGKELQALTEEKVKEMEEMCSTMAIENAELKEKLNKVLEELTKVQVKEE